MSVEINVVLEGAWSIGFAIENGKDRTMEYLTELQRKKKIHEYRYMVTELERFSKNGPPRNIKKFRHEGEGIYVIKKDQERLYGFFSGKHFFACAAGTTKKSQKADPEILAIVKRIKNEFEKHGSHHAR